MRINRYLSVCGAASRRKGEELIRSGRVTVNGLAVTDPARPVEPGADRVCLDGRPLEARRKRRWILLNKPVGFIVSAGDPFGRPTVFDLVGKDGDGLFPVGRLDADTAGVLLLTDDGDLAHRLTHPSFGVEKVYRARVKGAVGEEDLKRLAEGVVLDDGPAAPAVARVIAKSRNASMVEISLHQGRKRQVRRMFEHIGHPVLELERISFGGVTAKRLPQGSYRPLSDREIARLERADGHTARNGPHIISGDKHMKPRKPIVAIDGPVGAGKSTTARCVAEELGFLFVDTGAMYRAVTLDVLERGVDPRDEDGVREVAARSKVELRHGDAGQRTFLNGKDVSDRIRDRDVTAAVSAVSAQKAVRERMTEIQRTIGENGGVVMEGRDIGTVVFPDAEFKIYLDASIETRAERRHGELAGKGMDIPVRELIEEIRERDRANTERALAPLKKAPDAVLIDTTDMTFDEQVALIVSLVRGETG